MKTLRILYGWVLMHKHQDKRYQRPLNAFFENLISLGLVIIRLFRTSAFRKDAENVACIHYAGELLSENVACIHYAGELFDFLTAMFSASWLQGFTLFI